MLARIRPHLTYSNVMVTLLAIVVLGGGAFAIGAAVDKRGQIRACYVKRGADRGALRLLLKGRCAGREKAITWNLRGVPGQQGPPGQPGKASGPAGGDLTGSFPDPVIAPGAVNSAKVLDGSLGAADLGIGSVGAGQLLGLTRREGTVVVPSGVPGGVWNHGTATASCLPGEQLIGGSAAWDNENAGDPMAIVEVDPNFATNSVTVKGATDVEAARTLRAIAICL